MKFVIFAGGMGTRLSEEADIIFRHILKSKIPVFNIKSEVYGV